MAFCRRAPFPRRVFIPMGPRGAASRVNGFDHGSLFTYGYVRAPLAPGQLPVRDLARLLKKP